MGAAAVSQDQRICGKQLNVYDEFKWTNNCIFQKKFYGINCMESERAIHGQTLVTLRKLACLSQQDLALRSQLSVKTIARIEKAADSQRVSHSTIRKIAGAFNISVHALTLGDIDSIQDEIVASNTGMTTLRLGSDNLASADSVRAMLETLIPMIRQKIPVNIRYSNIPKSENGKP